MSKQESMKAAMRDVLEAKGVMGHLKAELRAAIFESLQDTNAQNDPDNTLISARPKLPPENLIINELIREYMAYNGHEHSLAVFCAECGSGRDIVPRAVLASQLNMAGAPSSVPLLYAMLHEARDSKDS